MADQRSLFRGDIQCHRGDGDADQDEWSEDSDDDAATVVSESNDTNARWVRQLIWPLIMAIQDVLKRNRTETITN